MELSFKKVLGILRHSKSSIYIPHAVPEHHSPANSTTRGNLRALAWRRVICRVISTKYPSFPSKELPLIFSEIPRPLEQETPMPFRVTCSSLDGRWGGILKTGDQRALSWREQALMETITLLNVPVPISCDYALVIDLWIQAFAKWRQMVRFIEHSWKQFCRSFRWCRSLLPNEFQRDISILFSKCK